MVSTIKNVGEFEKKMSEAGNKLVVLEFYATWCGPCKDMDSQLRKLAKLYKEQAVIIKVNVEKFSDISDYYKVRCMPTFVFLRNKRRVSSFAGADSKLLIQKMASLTKAKS